MRKVRISLRHTGDSGLRFGVSRGYSSNLHYNLFFGRLFLAMREKRPNEVPRKFVDLEFGRGQLEYKRIWNTMTDEEKSAYHEQRNPDNWAANGGPLFLTPFLEMYRNK